MRAMSFAQGGLAVGVYPVQTVDGLHQVDADGVDVIFADSSPLVMLSLAILRLAHGSLRGWGVHFLISHGKIRNECSGGHYTGFDPPFFK